MNQERWTEILDLLKQNFNILEEFQEDLENSPGTKHVLIFDNGEAKIKLERIIRPKIIDKKTTYSNRVGSRVDVEYIYSEDEFNDFIKAYRYDEEKDDWLEIEVERFYSF